MSGQQKPERIGTTMKSIKKNKLNSQLKYFYLLNQAQDQARQVGDVLGKRLLKVESRRIKGKYLFLNSLGMSEER